MNEYTYKDGFKVTYEMKSNFDEDGYILVRQMFEPEIVEKVKKTIDTNEQMKKYKYDIPDKDGNISSMIAWNQAGSDVTGMMARCERVVDLVEKVIRGSHKCGRLDHSKEDGQFSPNHERLEFVKQKFPLDAVEMKPGDAIFFHCNLLHMSEINKSDKRRIGFPIAFNRANNNPTKKHHHPSYSPINKVSNKELLDCTNITDMTGKEFIDLQADTIKSQLSTKH